MWICLLSTALLILVQAEEGDVFVAKEDWQEIWEGQKVPGGLHYRMNLETGKKEAKLLSQDDPDSSKGSLFRVQGLNPIAIGTV
jgi:nucleotide exchange factor SIL1